jgi:GT2 family glycosyltransferase
MPAVSVVIPVLNAARTLPRCLEALAALDPAPVEILLVDNGSTDNSVALLTTFAREMGPQRVSIVREARHGAAAARNAGVRIAGGDIIAFTDADCVPEPDWLHHLRAPFSDSRVGAVAGRVMATRPASTVELFSALYTFQSPDRPARHRHWTPWEGGFPTANLGVRRALLVSLGGFDEQLGNFGEDYDLCARLYAAGSELAYTPVARVAHCHRTTLIGMLRQAFGFGRSHPYLLRRHAGNGCWLDLPGKSLHWRACPFRAWLDLASADKKAMAILLAGMAHNPALWLFPLYAAWLVARADRRAKRMGQPGSPAAAFGLAGLLLLKSAAMTSGRWWGSLKYRSVCF